LTPFAGTVVGKFIDIEVKQGEYGWVAETVDSVSQGDDFYSLVEVREVSQVEHTRCNHEKKQIDTRTCVLVIQVNQY
jgi:hypothetical protein